MKRTLAVALFVMPCVDFASAQGPAPAVVVGTVEAAVREADAAFLKAYNAGDGTALAGLLTADVESVDEEGGVTRGREAVRKLYEGAFVERPGSTMTMELDSILVVAPGTVVETGRTTVTPADGTGPLHQQFTAVLVERGGAWLQAYVREAPVPVIDPAHRVKDMQWLLGDWVDESAADVVISSSKWSLDKRYLLREFTTHVRGEPVMAVSQRIGWDPASKQIKSWVFDSEGGHSEALWSRSGDRWVSKATGVLADGRTATATHVYTVVGNGLIKYQSIDRTIGAEALDDGPEYTLVPRPPVPGPARPALAPASPSSK